MKKNIKRLLLILLGLLVVIQVYRPDRENPPSDPALSIWSDPAVPADVKKILKVSCADCHSNNTEWPWYSNIAPASWLISHDVEEGRQHMNLSLWASWPEKRKLRKRNEIVEETEEGAMPLGKYTLLHPDAKLTRDQINTLIMWNGVTRHEEHDENDQR